MIKAHFRNIRTEILKEISTAEHSLKIAVAWFTNNEIFDALLSQCKKGNINVELIIICDSINIKSFGLDFNSFIQEGGKMYFGDSTFLMHHKFCIIDNRVHINGSYNWTFWAETRNNENITVFTDEQEVIENFKKEFEILISGKEQLQAVNPSLVPIIANDDQLLNYSAVKVSEYICSAVYLGENGREDAAAKIFEEVNKLNPAKINGVLQTGLLSGKQFYSKIYQTISTKTYSTSVEKTYVHYCVEILRFTKSGNYIAAINTANTCAKTFPNAFSVYVYCGDAKMLLNDIEGARADYNKALCYNFTTKAKLVYYNRVYNYPYFPQADIFLKLGDREKVIQLLKDAISSYTHLKIPIGVTKAETYLKRLENNETLSSIE